MQEMRVGMEAESGKAGELSGVQGETAEGGGKEGFIPKRDLTCMNHVFLWWKYLKANGIKTEAAKLKNQRVNKKKDLKRRLAKSLDYRTRHQAHVTAWYKTETWHNIKRDRDREKFAELETKRKKGEIAKRKTKMTIGRQARLKRKYKEDFENVSDTIVLNCLDLRRSETTPELIALKRQHILLKRELKQWALLNKK